MRRDPLFDLMAAVRAEFGVRSGREQWLNIVTVGDLHDDVAFAVGARNEVARAELWPRLVAVVAHATGLPPEQICRETAFADAPRLRTSGSRPAS